MQANGAIATAGQPSIVRSPDNTPTTLDALGIKRQRLAQARKLAAVMTEADVAEAVVNADAKKRATSMAELERKAAQAKREQDEAAVLSAAIAAVATMPRADDRWRVLHKDMREVAPRSKTPRSTPSLLTRLTRRSAFLYTLIWARSRPPS